MAEVPVYHPDLDFRMAKPHEVANTTVKEVSEDGSDIKSFPVAQDVEKTLRLGYNPALIKEHAYRFRGLSSKPGTKIVLIDETSRNNFADFVIALANQDDKLIKEIGDTRKQRDDNLILFKEAEQKLNVERAQHEKATRLLREEIKQHGEEAQQLLKEERQKHEKVIQALKQALAERDTCSSNSSSDSGSDSDSEMAIQRSIKVKQLKKQLKSAKARIKALEKEKTEWQKKKPDPKIQQLTQALARVEKELATAVSDKSQLASQVGDLSRKLTDSKAERAAVSEQLEKAKDDLKTAEARITTLEREKIAAEGARTKVQQELDDLRIHVKLLQQNVEHLVKAGEAAKAAAAEAAEALAKAEAQQAEVHSRLLESNRKILELEGEIARLEVELLAARQPPVGTGDEPPQFRGRVDDVAIQWITYGDDTVPEGRCVDYHVDCWFRPCYNVKGYVWDIVATEGVTEDGFYVDTRALGLPLEGWRSKELTVGYTVGNTNELRYARAMRWGYIKLHR